MRYTFNAEIFIIGVNPYVEVPENILNSLFVAAKKISGPIPLKGKLNGHEFTQTLVKFQGMYRLYLNGPMRKAAGIDVGDKAEVEIEYDSSDRTEKMNPLLAKMFENDSEARGAFEKLPPSHKKEYLRYLNNIKTEETLRKNVDKVIRHLHGEKIEGLIAVTYRSKRKKAEKTDREIV